MPGEKILKDVDLKEKGQSADDHARVMCRFVDHLHDVSLNNDGGGESRVDTFKRMDICQKMYDGKHYEVAGGKTPSHRAKSVTNHCFAVVEGAVPIICDNRPKAEIIPGAEADIPVVGQLKKVYDSKYEDLMLQLKTEVATKGQLIRGEWYWKIFWNPLHMGGLGDVDVQLISPRRLSFIGGSDPLMTDCYAVIYAGPHSLGELQAWYPKMAERLRKEWAMTNGDDLEADAGPGDDAGIHRSVSDDGDGSLSTYNTFGGAGSDGLETMTYKEVWLDDKTLVEVVDDWIVGSNAEGYFVYGKATQENQEQALQEGLINFEIINGRNLTAIGLPARVNMLRKYPFGRIIAKVGNVLLCDKPSPYTHGRSPYVRFFGCPVPGKNYFYGEIDQIISLQLELNKRKSQIIDIMNLTSNPPMLVNIMAGIKPNKMTNAPGLIIPVSMDVDRAAKWLQVPNIPSHLFVSISETQSDISTVTGYHDITQGRKPTGITAGVAIESLQEAAQTRYRQKARYLEYSLKLAAELILSVIWQFYREPRVIRTKSKDKPGGYEFDTVNFAEASLAGGLPDVRIESGSTMPVNEAVRRQQTMELFQIISGIAPQAGLAFLPVLLEKWNYPDADGIMKKLNEALGAGQPQPVVQ